MARSTYVYTAHWYQTQFDSPALIGTFTVKHEMVSAVQRAIDQHRVQPDDVSVYRHRDGFVNMSETGSGEDITAQFTWGAPA